MVTKFCFAGPEQNRTDVQASRKVSKNFSGRGGAAMRVERFATSKTLTGSGVRRRAPQRKTLRSAASPRARGVVFSSRLFAAPLREKSVNKKIAEKAKNTVKLLRAQKSHFLQAHPICRKPAAPSGKVNAAHSSLCKPQRCAAEENPAVSGFAACPRGCLQFTHIRRGCCKKLRSYPLNRTG